MFNKDLFQKITKIFAYAYVAYETLQFAMEKLEAVQGGTYQVGAVKDAD